jgi:hypothetical protein
MDRLEQIAMRLADDYADEFVSIAARNAILKALQREREAALEEAARVAENAIGSARREIADAIRTLKSTVPTP